MEAAGFKSESNPSKTPAAVATHTPHPLPSRQHLIKMARKLCPLPRRRVLRLGGWGWGGVKAALGFLGFWSQNNSKMDSIPVMS